MKRVLIPVILILVILVGSIVYAVSFNFNRVQYDKDLLAHVIDVSEGGELVAEYDGTTVRILDGNLTRMQKVLGVSDRDKLLFAPDYDAEHAIVLTFSDGAEYIIAVDESEEDAVFLCYSYKNKVQWYSISGYKTMDWTQKAVSPEGVSTPNEVIE